VKFLEYIIRALDRTSEGTNSAKEKSKSLASSIMSNLANIKAGWDMATSAVGESAKNLWDTIKQAFKFETLTIQFSVLMGSMSKAKERMKELAAFAAETPFNMEEVVTASRQLHVFSDGALGASSSLTLVGDAASATGQSLQEVAFWVGRAYSMIKGGKPFVEAAMRLQGMGLITPGVRDKMESLQAAGKKNSEVWAVLSDRLAEFKGGMKQLSQSGDGLISTLEDTYTAAKRTFGEEFKETAKKAISGLIEWIDRLTSNGTITKWARQTLDMLYAVAAAAKAVYGGGADAAKAWGAIRDVFVGALELGAQKATSLLEAAAPRIGAMIGKAASIVAENAADPFKENSDRKIARDSLGINLQTTPQRYWGFYQAPAQYRDETPEEKARIDERLAEMRRMAISDAAKGMDTRGSPTSDAQARMERGLKTLAEMGKALKSEVESAPSAPASASDKAAEAAKKAADEKKAAEQKAAEESQIASDMAREQAVVDARKKAETDTRNALEAAKDATDPAKDRLSRANDEAQKAWGWYRDPESFKAQLQEEQANADAEKQFKRDLARLQERKGGDDQKGINWRTASLSDSDEAVRRVALAREEQDKAKKSLEEISKNTKDLAKKMDEIMRVKQ